MEDNLILDKSDTNFDKLKDLDYRLISIYDYKFLEEDHVFLGNDIKFSKKNNLFVKLYTTNNPQEDFSKVVDYGIENKLISYDNISYVNAEKVTKIYDEIKSIILDDNQQYSKIIINKRNDEEEGQPIKLVFNKSLKPEMWYKVKITYSFNVETVLLKENVEFETNKNVLNVEWCIVRKVVNSNKLKQIRDFFQTPQFNSNEYEYYLEYSIHECDSEQSLCYLKGFKYIDKFDYVSRFGSLRSKKLYQFNKENKFEFIDKIHKVYNKEDNICTIKVKQKNIK